MSYVVHYAIDVEIGFIAMRKYRCPCCRSKFTPRCYTVSAKGLRVAASINYCPQCGFKFPRMYKGFSAIKAILYVVILITLFIRSIYSNSIRCSEGCCVSIFFVVILIALIKLLIQFESELTYFEPYVYNYREKHKDRLNKL